MRRFIFVAAIALLYSSLAWAQNGVPRASDGQPYLSGVWRGGTNVPGTWEQANSGVGVGGSGTNPDVQPILSSADRGNREGAPYQDWAAKKVLESFNNRAIDDPTARCLPAGVPRAVMLGLFPQKFVQTPKEIIVLYEYMNVFRTIPLNAKHPDDILPGYMGDSVGRWEGDTLVVDVIGFNDRTWLAGAGTFHTEALHVTERYTRVNKDQINYDVTMEDPNVFTKPWTLHSTLMLRQGTRLEEDICQENNVTPETYEKFLKDGVKFSR